ncbi:cytochrome c oxidase subunit II [Caballeronia humi]|uniref:Cytochrome aa3 subunit 2 n=1 Tax=Caballeronia humi TaxID=326474 RepID=A0A158JGM7_9BURK|nr:monoheme cytochrome c [Caballeronia humi]
MPKVKNLRFARRALTPPSFTVAAASASILIAAPSAHAQAPLNYFLHAAGPAAYPTRTLGWIFTAICVVVCVIVSALLIGALRRRRDPASPGEIGATGEGMRWIWIGVGVSGPVLAGMLIFALFTLQQVATPLQSPAITVTVTAYDWWWKVSYSDPHEPAQRFETANEIHIPVGEPIRIVLKSADVIHTFWVPRLAGKTQAIPGQANEQWIQADSPGVYRGQCSQFCGAQHAHMAFEVVAQSRADYNNWSEQQARRISANVAASVVAGNKIFLDRCAGCHAVRGTDASGALAPDLTHLNSRRMIAAGTLRNTAENQLDWIAHAQLIKPDARMPSINLNREDVTNLRAFLSTLD